MGDHRLLAIKVMVLVLSQLVTACACFVGFGLLPVGTLGLLAAWLKFFVVIVGVSVVGGVVGRLLHRRLDRHLHAARA